MNFLKKLKNWIKGLVKWLSEAKLLWLGIIIIFIAFLVSVLFPTKSTILISGFILQILGMSLAIRGLLKIRQYFNHDRLWTLFLKWIKRFPKWTESIQQGSFSIELSGVTGFVSAGIWHSDDKSKPIEERLDVLSQNILILRETQSGHQRVIDSLQAEIKNLDEKTKYSTDNLKLELNQAIEKLHTDDLMISLIGLVWLIFGIGFSTFPYELNKFIILIS